MDRSNDILSVSKMVVHAAPLAAPAKLNRVPLAGVAGKGSCDPGAGVGGDAPAAAGDAPEGSGDDTGDKTSGDAADDALGDSAAGRAAGRAGEEAGDEAEALAGLAIAVLMSDDELMPASSNALTLACLVEVLREEHSKKNQGVGQGRATCKDAQQGGRGGKDRWEGGGRRKQRGRGKRGLHGTKLEGS